MELVILMVFGFTLIWLFVLLPQRRRQAKHDAMLAQLAPGDEIVTAGGLYGTITELYDDDLGLEIADGVEVRVARRAIAARLSEDDETGEEPGDEPDEEPTDEVAAPDAEEPR